MPKGVEHCSESSLVNCTNIDLEKVLLIMVSLAEMKVNTTGVIKQLGEGAQFQAKMHSLNFRIGKRIRIIGKSILNSPVVVEVDNTRVAVGMGMAQKVFLEVINEDPSHGQSKCR
jgi:ferrous iron transport protein A